MFYYFTLSMWRCCCHDAVINVYGLFKDESNWICFVSGISEKRLIHGHALGVTRVGRGLWVTLFCTLHHSLLNELASDNP